MRLRALAGRAIANTERTVSPVISIFARSPERERNSVAQRAMHKVDAIAIAAALNYRHAAALGAHGPLSGSHRGATASPHVYG